MIRELVLDTETTGFYPKQGDKVVEIGIIELINHIPTKKAFHKYLNPQRTVPESAFKIHGLNYNFLKDKPIFGDIAEEMLSFIGDDKIIIHNASFDLAFLNNELSIIEDKLINSSQVIDTLTMARAKYPGSPCSLDALCRRFSIDNTQRQLHGALLDSHILAKVYLELIGGNQPDFKLETEKNLTKRSFIKKSKHQDTGFKRSVELPNRLTEIEKNNHKNFIARIKGIQNWKIYN